LVCDDAAIALSWDRTTGGAESVRINDDAFTMTRVAPGPLDSLAAAGTTYTIMNPVPILQLTSDGRSSGYVTPGEGPGSATLTLISIPRRYADYPEAMAARRTYSGRCEGLF